MSSAVFANSILHCLVFLYRGFGKLESQLKCFADIAIGLFNKTGNILLTKGFYFDTVIREPLLHLNHAVWIIQVNGQIVYSYRLRKGAEEQIYNKISDITISMKALDHLKMPELISNEYPVYMSEHEASLYDDMEAEMFLPLRTGEITAANAAALSGKLLQMANGAVYSDDGDEIQIHDQKLDALEDLIEAANGKPVMVAYWFKHDLTRIRRRLSERKISFEKLDSEESIRKWNRGELPVALIHPASAGHGLNLQSGGNILIWFGLTWSLELYQQTVARLWRQGQSAETVVVQHIITAGTIDEDVVKALANKDMTQNRLIAAVKARATHGR